MTDWKKLLDDIHSNAEKADLGYLRENIKGKDKKQSCITSLEKYLRAIYPETDDWVWNKPIPASVQKRLSKNANFKTRHFRPDAFSESLCLAVEFDGLPHYQSLRAILNDKKKDAFYRSLSSLRVVRIPYWIQLSRTNIKYLLGVDVKDEMCTLDYSFFDSPRKGFGLSISPAAMNAHGFERFCREVSKEDFPDETRRILRNDLSCVYDACMQAYGVDAVLKNSNPLFV